MDKKNGGDRWVSDTDSEGNRIYKDNHTKLYIDNIYKKPAGEERNKAIANFVYANINGNGNIDSCDGWRFRGSGLIQLTGRENFKMVEDKIAGTWNKSILTDAGADEVRRNLELAVLTSMGYFLGKGANAIANGADSDKEILEVCLKIGRDDVKNGVSKNHEPKKRFFKEQSSITFKTSEFLLGIGSASSVNEKSIIIEVNRIKHNSMRTISTFTIDGGVITGYILERDGQPASKETVAKSKKRIKAGTYNFDITTWSDKEKYINTTLRIHDVPGRTGILLHWGNTPGWSEGCLLGNPKEPINGNSNTKEESQEFVLKVVEYVREREKEIKKKYNLKTIEKKIIIKQNKELND